MNKNLPVEIWDMIAVERKRAFKLRVEEFDAFNLDSVIWKIFFDRNINNLHWGYYYLNYYYYSRTHYSYHQAYTHENRSGFCRGPTIHISVQLNIAFRNGCISHYSFVKRSALGREVIQYYCPYTNE